MRASHDLDQATRGSRPAALGADPAAGPGLRKSGTFSRESASEAQCGRFLSMTDRGLRAPVPLGALALAASLALAGCDARPIESARTGNPDVEAALIARIEGCNLYRVRDGANRSVYVAICPEGATRSSWSEGCGKGCNRDMGSLTVRARQGRD